MTDGGSPKAALLALLSAGPRHEEKHVCYERVRVDKGEQVREIVHYHVSSASESASQSALGRLQSTLG